MRLASARGNLALALAAALLASMPLWATPYHMQLASTALVASMFALSLQLLVGGAGLVSLAHAGFFGLGAYAVYLVGPLPIWLTLPVSLLLAALAAAVIGPLALRTSGFFFLMTTLAFGQMLFFLFHDSPLGGGTDGVYIQRPWFGFTVTKAQRPPVFLLLNLAILVLMYAGLWTLMRTMYGRALLGVRANEARMRAMGHDVQRLKLWAFIVAGALAGVAGHMAALTDAFVSPDLLGWHRSAEALLMVLLGGIGALHGPILGAFGLTLLQEAGQMITERERLVEGAVILAAVLLLRHGLAGLVRPRALATIPGPDEPAPMPDGQGITATADGLSFRYGGLRAVADVSLTVTPGELHAVIGPNGAGKSTLVNLLAGTLRPSEGRFTLGDTDVTAVADWRRARSGIGRSFQRTNLMLDMTVRENVRLAAQAALVRRRHFLRFTDPATTRAASAVLRRVGLLAAADQPARTLSHGQSRQLEIAVALAGAPGLLLLDEPLAGMGPEESAPLAALLRTLARDHAVLLVEHDMDVVFAVADRITVMVDGRVLASGTPAEIRANAAVRDAYLGHSV
jgi:branched-chain amino acid transport system permease protein